MKCIDKLNQAIHPWVYKGRYMLVMMVPGTDTGLRSKSENHPCQYNYPGINEEVDG
jgi:hypothetical protein